MAWNRLEPIAKTSGRPMSSASVTVNKDGVAKVALILSASIHEEFGEFAKADISAGCGEDAGSLLLEFSPNGAFVLTRFAKGGGRFFIPISEGVPDKPTSNVACRLGDKTKTSIVIHLPVKEWDQEIAARLRGADRRSTASSATAAPNSPPPAPPTGAKLNVVDYLKGKGVLIERLAGGRFQLNGETVGMGVVLRVANEHRKAADLDPLALAQVV